MSTPTATPRTDAEEKLAREKYESLREAGDPNFDDSPYFHARILETELADAQAECERLKFATEGHLLKTIQQQAELARLRAELAVEKNWVEHHSKHADDLIGENVRLRALFPAICSALGNGAFCTPDVSIGFLESIPNEVASVVARLRADLERFTGHGLLDCHAICDQRDAAITRAAHAEAALAEWSVLKLWGGTPEIIHEFIKGQQNRIHHCQDLETELAHLRAAIDAAMKP